MSFGSKNSPSDDDAESSFIPANNESVSSPASASSDSPLAEHGRGCGRGVVPGDVVIGDMAGDMVTIAGGMGEDSHLVIYSCQLLLCNILCL